MVMLIPNLLLFWTPDKGTDFLQLKTHFFAKKPRCRPTESQHFIPNQIRDAGGGVVFKLYP